MNNLPSSVAVSGLCKTLLSYAGQKRSQDPEVRQKILKTDQTTKRNMPGRREKEKSRKRKKQREREREREKKKQINKESKKER